MNEEIIQSRLDTIEEKLDKLTELTQQTALQEYRLSKLEETVTRILEKKESAAWKVITPVVASITSAIIAWIVSGGLTR